MFLFFLISSLMYLYFHYTGRQSQKQPRRSESFFTRIYSQITRKIIAYLLQAGYNNIEKWNAVCGSARQGVEQGRKGRVVESVAGEDKSGIMKFPETRQEELTMLCSAAGRVVYLSGGLKLLLEEDLTGRNLNDFMEDRTVARLISQIQSKKEAAFECTLGGQRFSCEAVPMEEHIHISLIPMSRRGGVSITMNASRFISRELNTDLSLMLPVVQQLERAAEEGQLDGLAMLRRSIYRLIRMTRDLEDCAAAENGFLEMHIADEDLTAICRELAQRLEPLCTGGVRVRWSLPEQPLIWRVDAAKFRRMLLHLISNAMAARTRGSSIAVALRQRTDEVCLSVTDDGPGIDSAVLGSVFRKYDDMDPLQKAGPGAGFGLALVRAFAEKHGGRLLLVSNEGGTSAQIILPRLEGPAEPELHCRPVTYGAGVDPLLVELSTVLDASLYRKKP